MDEMGFNRKCLFYIVMENMQGVSIKELLNKKEHPLFANHCKIIKRKIRNIIACLIRHQLFHNDLNGGNIFVLNPDDLENAEIGIIDFGEAGIAASDSVMLLFECPKRSSEPTMSQRTDSMESVVDPWAFFNLEEEEEYEATHKKARTESVDRGGKRKKTIKNLFKSKYRESKKHRTSQSNHKIKRSKKHTKHYIKTLKKKNATPRPNNNRRPHSKKGMKRK